MSFNCMSRKCGQLNKSIFAKWSLRVSEFGAMNLYHSQCGCIAVPVTLILVSSSMGSLGEIAEKFLPASFQMLYIAFCEAISILLLALYYI